MSKLKNVLLILGRINVSLITTIKHINFANLLFVR